MSVWWCWCWWCWCIYLSIEGKNNNNFSLSVYYQFFKLLVRNRYCRKPCIFTDGGSGGAYSISTIIQPVDGWLRLPHQMYSTELKKKKKNMMMERFIYSFIHSSYQGQECFDNDDLHHHFPSRKPDCDRQTDR